MQFLAYMRFLDCAEVVKSFKNNVGCNYCVSRMNRVRAVAMQHQNRSCLEAMMPLCTLTMKTSSLMLLCR
jgi:hypothetical protein